ncbi:MAG: ExbD/TolR family protein [Flavobacteriales bacterium]
MAKRELEEINAGSMADIAFLLLIFFLVTTTMNRPKALERSLPQKIDNPETFVFNERDVFEVLVNSRNDLLVENKYVSIEELKDLTKEFYTNPKRLDNLPQLRTINEAICNEKISEIKAGMAIKSDDAALANQLTEWEDKLATVGLIGEYKELPKVASIRLQSDNGTTYDMYFQVQNELEAAINELRDELSLKKFEVEFSDLNPRDPKDQEKVKAIRTVYPQRIVESYRNVGEGAQ